jgi:LemA protein
MTVLMVVISLIVLVIFYIITIYNRLVKLNNLTQEGWSGIDVQLKQRADLIPNLIETVKGYVGHERGVLEEVTKLRSQCLVSGNIQERAANENMLTGALRQLFAVSENYPDLKASQNFTELQQNLASIESQIQLARRYYNGTVRDFNTLVQSFPSNLIAQNLQFTSKPFFEMTDVKDREVPKVSFTS